MLLEFALADWFWVAGALLMGYTVFGFGGFGAGIVALPLIAHVMPLREAVPMTLLLDLIFAGWIGWRQHKEAQHRELWRLAPGVALGMGVGVLLLVRAPEAWLVGVLGAFVTLYALHSLLRGAPPNTPLAGAWAGPAGLVGGVFSALYGTGGPVYTLYLARRIGDPTRLRATTGTLIFASALIRLGLFLGGGLLASGRVLALACTLLPVAGVGYLIGSRLHAQLPAALVRRLVWGLLVLSGLSLLARGLV